MLIDCSYFINGPRHIQNATLSSRPTPASAEVNDAIMAYVRLFQLPFLKGTLGSTVAGVISSYMEQVESDKLEQRDDALDAVIQRLKEPFANYVFYKILRDGNTHATMTGLVRLKCANDYVAPIRRQVSTWNDMVDMLAEFVAWCQSTDCPTPGIKTDSNFLTKINALNL